MLTSATDSLFFINCLFNHCRNSQQFKLLLHHLYKQIPDIMIVDSSCIVSADMSATAFTYPTQSFLNDTHPGEQQDLRSFLHSLDRQLQLVENTLADKSEIDKGHYRKFRNDLCELEKETDNLYLKLNENRK